MKRLLSLGTLVAFTLTGCASAELVNRTYRPTKGGTVKYSKNIFMAEKNREEAMKKMAEYCQPQAYSIISEDDKTEFTGRTRTTQTSATSSQTNQDADQNTYIRFNCSN